jgi:hypothetical protein
MFRNEVTTGAVTRQYERRGLHIYCNWEAAVGTPDQGSHPGSPGDYRHGLFHSQWGGRRAADFGFLATTGRLIIRLCYPQQNIGLISESVGDVIIKNRDAAGNRLALYSKQFQ